MGLMLNPQPNLDDSWSGVPGERRGGDQVREYTRIPHAGKWCSADQKVSYPNSSIFSTIASVLSKTPASSLSAASVHYLACRPDRCSPGQHGQRNKLPNLVIISCLHRADSCSPVAASTFPGVLSFRFPRLLDYPCRKATPARANEHIGPDERQRNSGYSKLRGQL